MADILIRGMKMPKTCAICKIRSCNSYCPLNIGIKFFLDPRNTGFDFCTGRHSDCPLHELPEHGDLIDRVKLVESKYVNNVGILVTIAEAPVIVPSNKEETE